MHNPFETEMSRTIYEGMSEHEHQRELFSWAACVRLYGIECATRWAWLHPKTGMRERGYLKENGESQNGDYRLDWLMAIPNAGHGARGSTGAVRGARMRAEGLRAGVADVFLPYPVSTQIGDFVPALWIEMKKRGGVVSAQQDLFLLQMGGRGYKTKVCYGYFEAVNVITEYLSSNY